MFNFDKLFLEKVIPTMPEEIRFVSNHGNTYTLYVVSKCLHVEVLDFYTTIPKHSWPMHILSMSDECVGPVSEMNDDKKFISPISRLLWTNYGPYLLNMVVRCIHPDGYSCVSLEVTKNA